MGVYYKIGGFKMTSYCGGKLLKKHSTPDEFEMQIGHTIQDLETNSDLKDLRGLSIVAAKEIDVGDKKCIVLFVPVPMLKASKSSNLNWSESWRKSLMVSMLY